MASTAVCLPQAAPVVAACSRHGAEHVSQSGWQPAGRVRRAATTAAAAAAAAASRSCRLQPSRGLPSRSSQQQRASRLRRLSVNAIGFELPGADANKSAEKAAEELSRAAASLLLYTAVLKSKPSQSFLAVLQLLQKGNPLLLTQQYGELYRQLAGEGYSSWMDYLLDQVIKGSDNPFAKAAAAGKPHAHMLPAAAHDLDRLQQLAVADRTLATWVKDTVYGLDDAWLDAACSLAPPPQAAGEPVHDALLAPGYAPPPALLAPLTDAQRAGLRERLASAWRWGENAELLARYHASHGAGLVSQHRVLTWTGKLQAADVLKGASQLSGLQDEVEQWLQQETEELVKLVADFAKAADLSQAPAPPVFAVLGEPEERWRQMAFALHRLEQLAAAEKGRHAAVRTVVLPAAQLQGGAGLADLAWSLSQHPRARFVVVVHSGLDKVAAEAAAVLSRADGFSWPPNAAVVAGYDSPAGVPRWMAGAP